VKEGKTKMVVVDRIHVTKDQVDIISDENLKILHEACKEAGAMLVVDITRAYPLILREKNSL
jgi:hypothetical protein